MDSLDDKIWSRRDCVSADVEGSLVLLDLEKLVYHSLNITASAVWQALETPSTVSSVSHALVERFQVDPDHCTTSVKRLLLQLEAQNLVTSSPAPESQDTAANSGKAAQLTGQ